MSRLLRSGILAGAMVLATNAFLPTPADAADTPAVNPLMTDRQQAADPDRPDAVPEVEQRIRELGGTLRISAAQRPQWDRFTGLMRSNARSMDERFERRLETMPTMSAAENMHSYAHLVVEHGRDVQALTAAFDTLYAGLSVQQKRTIDQSFRDDAHRGDVATGGQR